MIAPNFISSPLAESFHRQAYSRHTIHRAGGRSPRPSAKIFRSIVGELLMAKYESFDGEHEPFHKNSASAVRGIKFGSDFL